MYTCTKTYSDLPFAHRQHNHQGHCALIHGHNWSFTFTFTCSHRDDNGFVVDFGQLKWLKQWLEENFDHTLLLNADDPALTWLQQLLTPIVKVSIDFDTPLLNAPFAKIIVVPNASSEGLARWLFDNINQRLSAQTNGRVSLVSITVTEDSKNSASYVRE